MTASESASDRAALHERERIARFSALMRVVNRRLRFTRIHRTHARKRLDFSDRPYLVELIQSKVLGEDVMKCVQCGVTESMVPLELAAAAEGLSVMVVLPTETELSRFVHNRINRPMEYVPEYRKLLDETPRGIDNVGFKEFGAGILNAVTAGTEVSFKEIPIDLLVVEELDQCDETLLELADDRLTDSDYGLRFNISNPTGSDQGIHKLYKKGTQREWHVRCRHPDCDEAQPLDWFTNVVRKKLDSAGQVEGYELLDAEWTPEAGRDVRCYCRKCGEELDRYEADPAYAFWRDLNPGAARRSRHFSQLFQRGVPLTKLWHEFQRGIDNTEAMKVFYRSKLGLPYSAPGSQLTEEILNGCVADYLVPDAGERTVFGLDVGARFDLQVWQAAFREGNPWRRLLYADKLDSLEAVEHVLQRYRTCIGVADARPETHLLREFQRHLHETYGGRILWRCDFQQSIRGFAIEEEEGIVKVDRTSLLDASAESFVRRLSDLPRAAAGLIGGRFYAELVKPERVTEASAAGRERKVWRGKPDHQFLTAAYAYLAALMGGFFDPRVDAADVVHAPQREGEFALC